MTQNVCVSVQMDEKGFRDFASFDLLRHNKGRQRPAVFTAILLVCAGICLSQIGKREGAGLLHTIRLRPDGVTVDEKPYDGGGIGKKRPKPYSQDR